MYPTVAEAVGATVVATETSGGRATLRVVAPLTARARVSLGVPLRVANVGVDLVRKWGAMEPWPGVRHRLRPGGRAT